MTPVAFNAACLRKVSNWSILKKEHKFDKSTFESEQVKNDMDLFSPKLAAFIKNINEIDEKDMKIHGKKFKHFIFSEVKQGGYGVKIIAAAMIASGFTPGFKTVKPGKKGAAEGGTPKKKIIMKLQMLNDETLLQTKSNNFMMLSSSPINNAPLTVETKKKILSKFNERPANINGELARFILLDAGFKEGIDLFDVKYVHIFEPQTSKADQKQAIGRATRLCGQKGLEFDPKKGWPLEVYLYDSVLSPDVVEHYGSKSLFHLFLKNSGIDLRKMHFANELEKYVVVGSVDYELTKNIHGFKIEDDDDEVNYFAEIFKDGGSMKSRYPEVHCDKPCLSRPSKMVPIGLPLFTCIYLSLKKDFPDLRKSNLRAFYCNLLKTDAGFCAQVKKAWEDEEAFVVKHASVLKDAFKNNKHSKLPQSSRSGVLRYVNAIFKKHNIKAPVEMVVSSSKDLTVSTEIIPLPNKKSPVFKGAPPTQYMDFLGIRNHIRDHYGTFAWPKVKLENLCVPKGGAEVVKFTPTQNFIRHFFTPDSAYKGMLLYHGVGTGKTCCAIATASTFFEKEGYTILWVTRTTLKSDIYKNMFDQVCNLNLQDKANPKKSMLSKSWKFNPMSYKQFSNLVSGKNALYDQLVKQNGAQDPLKKTLLIIDEAHKLYGGNDLSGNERPDMEKFKASIMNSYEKSGKDSVRLLMMTATPITNDPMELIKIVNLCKESDRQLPDDYEAFAKIYNNEEGMFTKKGARQFLDAISGHVSYLNREKDARQFSQPIIIPVDVPMSGSMAPRFSPAEIKAKREAFKKVKVDLAAKKKDLTKERNDLKKTCVGLKKTDRAECLERIAIQIKQLEENVKEQMSEFEKNKEEIQNHMNQYKTLKADKFSQGSIIMKKCLIKARSKPLEK